MNQGEVNVVEKEWTVCEQGVKNKYIIVIYIIIYS